MARKRGKADDPLSGGAVHVPRSRGALSGLLLLLAGIWGALIPFVGPVINFAFTPDDSWNWTAGRGWLEVLPGVVTAVGGLLLLLSANRITALLGSWLAVAGGVWFIIGTTLAPVFHLGTAGTPTGSGKTLRAIESLAFFDGLGALILFLGAASMGRLSVRSVRDVRAAQRRRAEEEAEEEREVDHRRMENERRQAEERREAEERRASEEGNQGQSAQLSDERRQADDRRQAEERRLAAQPVQQPVAPQPQYQVPQTGPTQSGQGQPTPPEQPEQPYRSGGASAPPNRR